VAVFSHRKGHVNVTIHDGIPSMTARDHDSMVMALKHECVSLATELDETNSNGIFSPGRHASPSPLPEYTGDR
jgi:hypothetical protein